MTILNFKNITSAVETLLNDNTTGTYLVERNYERNGDPNKAMVNNGWIGIYRDSLTYGAHTTGSSPWLVDVAVRVEIQIASMLSSEDCEDKMEDAVNDVLTVLNANRTLDGTVLMTNGYDISYEINAEHREVWYHATIIRINAEVRA